MNINYNSLFKFFIPYFIIILIAYIIASVLYFILPSNPKLYEKNDSNELEYKRFNINNAFKEKFVKQVQKKQVQKKQEYSILNSLKLLAVYAFSDNSGYIVIKENSNNDSIILSVNEEFKNYVLKKVYNTYAVFSKNDKDYKLELIEDKNDVKFDVIEKKDTIKTTKSIFVNDDQVVVKRELIDNYIKNFDKIWDDIGINEVRTNNGIDGFKVTRIKKGTPFDKIGLKKGDIIRSINNVQLNSYNDAFKIYKKINKIQSLNLVVLRNNIETEIYYEIK